MSDALEFDPHLYRDAAVVYDRFRVLYPSEMIDHLVRRARLSGQGRLLDLACGTGQITFAIADRFAEVWAVDQEPGMIELVRSKAQAAGGDHMQAVVSAAETLAAPVGAFELVTIGNAFHRLRRDEVAANSLRWSQPNGHVALLWSAGPSAGNDDWQITLSAVVSYWATKAGAHTRVPAGWEAARRTRPDAAVLRAAGSEVLGSSRFPTTHDCMVDALIGYANSTSLLPKAILGKHAEEFENDLRRELTNLTSGGTLTETIDFAYELARRPVRSA